jgi:hypothetical protein
MAVFSNTAGNKPRWFWRLALLAFTLSLVVGALLWRSLETTEITVIQARVEGLKPVFTGIRWLLVGLVAGYWPAITHKLYRSGRIDEPGKARLLAMRWRILVWLVLLELILGQNLPGHLLQAIQESGA